MARQLRIGAAGLGRGFTVMLPALAGDPRVTLVAAADPRAEARARFAADFKAKVYETVEELCADRSVDVVYVATPHSLHAAHTKIAAQAGKHVLVEKPMAISIAECQAMTEAARKANVTLIVGHSHSFDAPYARARQLIDSGAFGAARMIAALNYTDFVYRPRRPEEFETAQGGGAVFSQAAHQIDIVRLLAGARAKTVRAIVGAWDRTRPMDGAYAALVNFENGLAATLTYSGYGHFDSAEWLGGIGELGQETQPLKHDRKRFESAAEESAYKQSLNYGGENYRPAEKTPKWHQSFGTFIVSCERADLRPLPSGVMIYQNGVGKLETLAPPPAPRAEVIDELYEAVINGVAPRHGGEWAMATLEICLAILQSTREQREIELKHQT